MAGVPDLRVSSRLISRSDDKTVTPTARGGYRVGRTQGPDSEAVRVGTCPWSSSPPIENYVRTVSDTLRTPPVKHGDLRGHADAHRCCGKSLIGSALVGFGVRQHARAESISKRAPSTTRTSLHLDSTICEGSATRLSRIHRACLAFRWGLRNRNACAEDSKESVPLLGQTSFTHGQARQHGRSSRARAASEWKGGRRRPSNAPPCWSSRARALSSTPEGRSRRPNP